jgi:hypothetical protein
MNERLVKTTRPKCFNRYSISYLVAEKAASVCDRFQATLTYFGPREAQIPLKPSLRQPPLSVVLRPRTKFLT